MAIKIQNTTIVTDEKNLTNVNVATANVYYGDGSKLTGISAIPVGALQYFSGQTSTSYPGSNWLLCDGSVYSKATYPELANILGNIVNYYTWSDSPTTSTLTNRKIVYGNATFLIASSNATNTYFRTTTDGINFNQSSIVDYTMSIVKDMKYSSSLGKYVAVGTSKSNSGSVMTSTDGTTWTKLGLPTNNAFKLPITINSPSDFIAAANNEIYTSTNGINWTLRSSGVVNPINKIATDGAGRFVYVGNNTVVGVSTDAGVTWNTYTPANTQFQNAVAYGNGIFVSGGLLASLQTSTDGITWASRTSGAGGTINDIIYGGGKFILCAAGNNNLRYSTDGITWTAANVSSFANIYKLSYDSSSGNYNCADVQGLIGTSTDGITWYPSNIQTNNTVNGYEYLNNTHWYFGGGGYLASSTDGVTLSVKTTNTSNSITSLAYANGNYVARVSGSNTLSILNSTDNGATWTLRDSGSPTITIQPLRVVSNNGIFAHLGGSWGVSGASTSDGVFTSTDGIEWALVNANHNTPYSVVKGSDKYVTVGAAGYIGTSTDLIKWVKRTSGTTSLLYTVTYNSGTYVAAGQGGVMLTSSDGITWTAGTSGTTSTIYSLAYGNGTYVYSGAGGVIATSSDGTTWTARTSGTTSILYSLEYTNNVFLAGGAGGRLQYSSDGITWTARTSGTTSSINTISYLNSKYMYGTVGAVASSTDNITWTIKTLAAADTIYKLQYDGAKYVAFSRSQNTYYTPDLTAWTQYVINMTSNASNNRAPVANYYDSANSMYYILGNTVNDYVWRQSAANFLTQTWVGPGPQVSATNYAKTLNNKVVFVRTAAAAQNVLTTSDFITYSQVSSAAPTGLSATPTVFRYLGGYYVAAKDTTYVYRSSDLVTWEGGLTQMVDTGVVATFDDISYYNGNYVIVYRDGKKGTDGQVAYGANVIGTLTTGLSLSSDATRAYVLANTGSALISIQDNQAILKSTNITNFSGLNKLFSLPQALNYINGKTIAVGNSTGILVSSDSKTFDNYDNSAVTVTSKNILWNGTKYIISNHNGDMYTSTNLTTWVSELPYSKTTDSVVYGNGKFVSVGSNGSIQTSTDGFTWNISSSGTTSSISALSYGNGKFVYGDYAGNIGTSTDGITWSVSSSGTTSSITDMVYGNGVFVAGIQGTTSYLTSYDASIWTTRDFGTPIAFSTSDELNYIGGLFTLAKTTGAWFSSDGVTWNKSLSSTQTVQSIGYGNNLFIAVSGTTGSTANGGGAYLFPYTYNVNTEFSVPVRGAAQILSSSPSSLYVKAL